MHLEQELEYRLIRESKNMAVMSRGTLQPGKRYGRD